MNAGVQRAGDPRVPGMNHGTLLVLIAEGGVHGAVVILRKRAMEAFCDSIHRSGCIAGLMSTAVCAVPPKEGPILALDTTGASFRS